MSRVYLITAEGTVELAEYHGATASPTDFALWFKEQFGLEYFDWTNKDALVDDFRWGLFEQDRFAGIAHSGVLPNFFDGFYPQAMRDTAEQSRQRTLQMYFTSPSHSGGSGRSDIGRSQRVIGLITAGGPVELAEFHGDTHSPVEFVHWFERCFDVDSFDSTTRDALVADLARGIFEHDRYAGIAHTGTVPDFFDGFYVTALQRVAEDLRERGRPAYFTSPDQR